MAKDLNKVMLIARLGADPEMRYTAGGTAVTNFRVAVNRRARRDQEGQEPREEADWFTIIAWRELGETCNQYLRKGSRCYLEGRLQTRSWEDQGGQKRHATEVVLSEMIMLDTRRSQGEGGDPGSERAPWEDEVTDIPF